MALALKAALVLEVALPLEVALARAGARRQRLKAPNRPKRPSPRAEIYQLISGLSGEASGIFFLDSFCTLSVRTLSFWTLAAGTLCVWMLSVWALSVWTL